MEPTNQTGAMALMAGGDIRGAHASVGQQFIGQSLGAGIGTRHT